MRREVVPLEKIIGMTNRLHGGEGDIRILAEDMELNGLIHPVTLYLPLLNDGIYNIVAGRRRIAAAKMLGWEKIEANVIEEDEAAKIDAIESSENINRLAMHPLDEATVFKKLLDKGESIESLAKRYDRAKSVIWQRVQLLDLNDGIKDLFKKGKISLHAAAMLKSLDAQQQEKFFEKFEDYLGDDLGEEEIEQYEVVNFISAINHDRLYKTIAGKECDSCTKRTRYSDKNLFPELNGTGDFCLDHECYLEKCKKVIAGKIKSHVKESPEHKGACIVAHSGELKRLFGKAVSLDEIEYEIKAYAYGMEINTAKANKNFLPCFEALFVGGAFELEPRYFKEPKKKEAKSFFAPTVQVLGLPKDEAAEVLEALEGNKKLKHWVLHNEIKERVFYRVIGHKANQPDDEKEGGLFLENFLLHAVVEDLAKICELFGVSKDLKELQKLSMPRLCTLLNACLMNTYQMPDVEDIGKPNDFIKWAGISKEELKAMYQEEIRSLLPKPGAAGNEDKDKKVKGKKAKKKGEE